MTPSHEDEVTGPVDDISNLLHGYWEDAARRRHAARAIVNYFAAREQALRDEVEWLKAACDQWQTNYTKLENLAQARGVADGNTIVALTNQVSTAHASGVAEGKAAALPKDPPVGLLISMAMCLDHGFGAPEGSSVDHRTLHGQTVAEYQESTLYDMRKLYDEMAGRGFYRPEREADYVRYVSPTAIRAIKAGVE